MTAADTNTGVVSAGPASAAASRRGLALLVITTAQLMVVLDSTIVNVALPTMEHVLHFSGTGLEWVVNAYALTFGGLMLLGGRAGDLLGRRKVFIAGMIIFSVASLVGGFANSQWLLLTARAVQGAGAAIVAPTSLALVSTTFPAGKERTQAMGVVTAMGGLGATIGLLAGGLLTAYVSWRWVLFVNAPIGLLTVLAAPYVLTETPRLRGRFDLPGAVLGTLGITLLVYGLIHAATSPDGTSHWGDGDVVVPLCAAVVLLAAFGVVQSRSTNALMPIRVVADLSRAGSYLIALCVGTAISGVFFFLTLFVQNVWGYSALRTGLSYLPMSLAIVVAAGVSAVFVARTGPRIILVAGGLITTGGMFWIAQIGVHSSYASGMLGASLLSGIGIGLIFTPMSLVGMSRVREFDSGAASSLVNAGRQVGGSIGLAVLGTIAWTVVAHSDRAQAASAHLRAGAALPASLANHALASGFSRGFLGGAAVMLLATIIAAVTIKVRGDQLETGA